MIDFIMAKYNFLIYIALMMLGLWGVMVKTNLVKKVIGVAIFQTAIILFYISIGAKKGASIPILPKVKGHGAHEAIIHAVNFANPLTQILMLTAIVVGVATLGVALTLIIQIYKEYGSIEEDDLRRTLEEQAK